MTPYKKCGQDAYGFQSGQGCKKYFNMKALQRCWQCGILLCYDCSQRHAHYRQAVIIPNEVKRGGEK